MSASFPLALIGREGFVGMIGVDMIGEIRRAYFEQHWPIKEIVRTLSVSRATVRKVVRSHKTEFKYERGSQPAPKLGEWVEVLTELLGKEAKLPRRERRSTQRLFEELRGRGYDGAHAAPRLFCSGANCGPHHPRICAAAF
jgi:transposase